MDPHTQRLDKRVTDLEMSVTHLQKDFETLNEAVLDQSKQLNQISNQLQRLLSRIESAEDGPEVRDPLAEKPPHY